MAAKPRRVFTITKVRIRQVARRCYGSDSCWLSIRFNGYTISRSIVSLPTLIASRFAYSLRGNGFARFTTIVSIVSVALGCIALIVAMSVLRGYEEAIVSTANQFAAPLEVRPLFGQSIPDAASVMTVVSKIDGVKSIDPTVSREALARTRKGVDGILLIGATPQRMLDLNKAILQGGDATGAAVPSQGAASQGALVGVDLAARLALSVGDTLVVYASSSSGTSTTPLLFTVRVRGLMRSGMQSFDDAVVVMDMAALQSALLLESSDISGIAVYPHEGVDVDDMARRVGSAIGPRLYPQTYTQRFQSMASWIALQKEPIPIVLGLISIVAVFTIISTLLIAVVEKTRSVAILRSLGMTSRSVMAIFVLNALRIGITGVVLGTSVSLAFVLAQRHWQFIRLDGAIYYLSSLPVSLSPLPFILVPSISLALCLVASVIPMILASRVSPVRALRFS